MVFFQPVCPLAKWSMLNFEKRDAVYLIGVSYFSYLTQSQPLSNTDKNQTTGYLTLPPKAKTEI